MSKLNFDMEAAAKIINRKFPYLFDVINSNKTKLLVDFFQSCNVSIERIESDWCDFSLTFEFTFLDDLATVIRRLK